MIVKTVRWKQKAFTRLLSYIDQDLDENGRNRPPNERRFKQSFTITNNFQSSPDDLQGLTEEFQRNDTYRKQRKNGVVLYHEMISFHNKDRENLNTDILKDLAEKWIDIRGDKALCFAKPHFHGSTPHVHFAFSGTEYESSKNLRMSDAQFKRYRKEIEAYQKEHYPELEHSLVYETKGRERVLKNSIEQDRNTRKQREHRVKMRGLPTQKELLSERLEIVAKRSRNEHEFLQELQKEGLDLYTYRNKTSGIMHEGKKYRFKQLGITPALWLEKEQQHTREQIKTAERDAEQERRVKELEKIQRRKEEFRRRSRSTREPRSQERDLHSQSSNKDYSEYRTISAERTKAKQRLMRKEEPTVQELEEDLKYLQELKEKSQLTPRQVAIERRLIMELSHQRSQSRERGQGWER